MGKRTTAPGWPKPTGCLLPRLSGRKPAERCSSTSSVWIRNATSGSTGRRLPTTARSISRCGSPFQNTCGRKTSSPFIFIPQHPPAGGTKGRCPRNGKIVRPAAMLHKPPCDLFRNYLGVTPNFSPVGFFGDVALECVEIRDTACSYRLNPARSAASVHFSADICLRPERQAEGHSAGCGGNPGRPALPHQRKPGDRFLFLPGRRFVGRVLRSDQSLSIRLFPAGLCPACCPVPGRRDASQRGRLCGYGAPSAVPAGQALPCG